MNRYSPRDVLLAILGFVTASALSPAAARADLYLNGGLRYGANSLGANVGGAAEWDSFNTPNNDLFFDPAGPAPAVTGNPLLLSPGVNTFTVTTTGSPPGGFNGLGLYFTLTSALLDGVNSPPTGQKGLEPHLVVFPSGGGFAFPAAGVMVPTLGQSSGDKPYSGATSYLLGAHSVTVTGWSVNPVGAMEGTLTLNVAAVPEASSLLAIGLAACATSAWAVWRRRAGAGDHAFGPRRHPLP